MEDSVFIEQIKVLASKDLAVDTDQVVSAIAITGRDIATRVDLPSCHITLTDIPLTSGIFAYAIPDYATFDRMKTVVYIRGDVKRELLPARIEEIEPLIQTQSDEGEPSRYGIWKGEILIWKTNSGTLKCKALRKFQGLADIDDKYIHVLAEGIFAQLYRPLLGTSDGLAAMGFALNEFKTAFKHLPVEIGNIPLQWGMSEEAKRRNRVLNSL